MTGWNLPPGCSVRDIPGNHPEDEADEALAEMISDKFKNNLDESTLDKLIEWAYELRSDAYSKGYAQCMADDKLAREENVIVDSM